MSSNKRLNAMITIGGSIAGSLKSAFSTASGSITRLGNEVSSLAKRQKELNQVIKDQEKLGRSGSALKVQYAQQELGVINKQIEALKKRQAVEQRMTAMRNKNMAQRAEIKGQMVDTLALGAMAGAPLVAAVQFETAMLGVAKQLDGARDSSGKLTQTYYDMAGAVKALGQELPIPTNQIAEMVAAGLRMGVAKVEVIDFVRESAKMSTAFDLPAGELAEQMGKIAGLYKIPIPAIGSLADAVNYLDDNAISKGGDIIEFLQRVGGVAGSVKITGIEMAALGSTLLTLGERTEPASTAINSMAQKLAAADKGTKKFKESVKEIGLSTQEIQKGMQSDAMGTILKVLDAVNKLQPEKRLGVLVEMFGLESSDTIAKLATNTAELRKQLELANSEAAKGSMTREFSARMATTSAQLEIAKNRVMELGINLGTVLLPGINSVLSAGGPMVTWLARIADEHPVVTKGIVGIATALVSLRVGIMAARYAWLMMQGAMLTSPIGAIIGAVAAGAVLIVQNWEPIRDFFISLWADITAAFRNAWAEITAGFEWVANKWSFIQSSFGGFGGADVNPVDIPSPAQANGGTVNSNNQTTINITQRPGENQEQLAKRVAKELEDNPGSAAMYDGAYAQ